MKFPDINNMIANIEVALVAICMIRNTMNFIFNMPHTEQSKSSGKKGERREAFTPNGLSIPHTRQSLLLLISTYIR